MVDLDYLTRLVTVLKAHGVTAIKMADLELTLSRTEIPATVAQGPPLAIDLPTKDQLIDVPVDESQLPVDLRTDQISDYDKILNWSAPDAQGEALPGVGEE